MLRCVAALTNADGATILTRLEKVVTKLQSRLAAMVDQQAIATAASHVAAGGDEEEGGSPVVSGSPSPPRDGEGAPEVSTAQHCVAAACCLLLAAC